VVVLGNIRLYALKVEPLSQAQISSLSKEEL
jgi:hypothetical protein